MPMGISPVRKRLKKLADTGHAVKGEQLGELPEGLIGLGLTNAEFIRSSL